MATTYLTRTQSSGTSDKIGTFSAWIKYSEVSETHSIFSGHTDSSNRIALYIGGSGALTIYGNIANSQSVYLITNNLLRDPSAWYHIVVAWDTTQGTDSNRFKIYVNGSQITSFSTAAYPSVNADVYWNKGTTSIVGARFISSVVNYFSGSMANVEFVDGQQLTPAYFGSTDTASGIWTPQASSTISSYGTNGFKLKMDTATPGADTSGNTNTFTVGGGTPTLTQGSPSNNYATFNPLYKSNETLQNGNTTSSLPYGNKFGGVVSIGVKTGKWYAEFQMNSGDSSASTAVGIYGNPITASNNDQGVGKENNSLSYRSDGQKVLENSTSSYGASYTTGDVIGVALDMTSATKNITFYKDGASQGNITFNLEQGNEYEGFMFMAANSNTASTGSDWKANFGEGFFRTTAAGTNADGNGQGLFAYAVPSGYYALNTKNLEAYG